MSEAEAIKSKIISFRVSDQEFGVVQEASQKHGFTSVSLFARETTLARHANDPVRTPLDTELNRLWRRLEILTTLLEKLSTDAVRLLAPFNKG